MDDAVLHSVPTHPSHLVLDIVLDLCAKRESLENYQAKMQTNKFMVKSAESAQKRIDELRDSLFDLALPADDEAFLQSLFGMDAAALRAVCVLVRERHRSDMVGARAQQNQ